MPPPKEDHQTVPGWPVISLSWSPLRGRGRRHAESASVPIRRIPAALSASATIRMAKTAELIERPGLRLKDRFEVNRGASRALSPAGPWHS